MKWQKIFDSDFLKISLKDLKSVLQIFPKLFLVSDILFHFSTAGPEITGQGVGPDAKNVKIFESWL
jgi:hypothetical protein